LTQGVAIKRAGASDSETHPGIHERDILIIGVARSGTTWLGRVLGKTAGAHYFHEPDNHDLLYGRPFVVRAKRSVGPYPVLAPGDEAQEYERLWASLFDGAVDQSRVVTRFVDRAKRSIAARLMRRVNRERLRLSFRDPAFSPPYLSKVAGLAALPPTRPECRVLITKSVYLPFCIDWLAARWDVNVVVVSRHPLAVIASWIELGFSGDNPRLENDPRIQDRYLERWDVRPLRKHSSLLSSTAWVVGLLRAAHDEAAARHPEWLQVSHDELCGSPDVGFRHLADECGLLWNRDAERFLQETNRPGSGYDIHRPTKEQPARWRQRFDTKDVKEIARVLERFPIRGWPNQAHDIFPREG
jgi:hypothetical protein